MVTSNEKLNVSIDRDLLESDLNRPISSLSDVSARSICDLLSANGIRTYIMGGAVRDWMLGVSARDIDIMTETSLGKVMDIIAPLTKNLQLEAKPHYGLMYVRGDLGDVDLNSMRDCDDIGSASDIDDVFFRPARSFSVDPSHRDFSINAFYYSVDDDSIINPFPQAVEDLKTRTLRIVTDDRKIEVDYRVTIRILQFMARGYSPTVETFELLKRRIASDILKTDKYRKWMDIHVPPISTDRSKFEALALQFTENSIARRTLERWFEEARSM